MHIPDAHRDTVSCVAADPLSHRPSTTLVFASGGLDGYVKLWRLNLEEDQGTPDCFLKFLHGEPVTSVVFFPEGALFVSGGGPDVKVWDVTGGGRLVHSFQSHVKTVTGTHHVP